MLIQYILLILFSFSGIAAASEFEPVVYQQSSINSVALACQTIIVANGHTLADG